MHTSLPVPFLSKSRRRRTRLGEVSLTLQTLIGPTTVHEPRRRTHPVAMALLFTLGGFAVAAAESAEPAGSMPAPRPQSEGEPAGFVDTIRRSPSRSRAVPWPKVVFQVVEAAPPCFEAASKPAMPWKSEIRTEAAAGSASITTLRFGLVLTLTPANRAST